MKKLINIFVVLSIVLTQTITAAYTDILDEAIKEITNVGVIVEADGTTNIYSGSVSIRFDETKAPKPLFTFTPPSIEAGCNGIDIKGMFMSLLGLDQLGEMLQNAGASLAWGVAVGLIYSLPGVASAFKFINQWAKKIQELLAAACSAGILIGQWLGKQAGLDKTGLGETINNFVAKLDPGNYAIFKQKGAKGLLELLGLSDIVGSLEEMPGEDKAKAIAQFFKGAFESDASTLGSIFSEIGKRAQKGTGNKGFELLLGINDVTGASSPGVVQKNFTITSSVGAAPEGAVSVGIDSFVSLVPQENLTASSQVKLALFAYVLQYNFMGDIAMELPKKESVDALFNIAVSTDSNATAKAQAREEWKKSQKIDPSKLSVIGPGQGVAENKAAQNLAEFIWYGVEDPGNTEPGHQAKSAKNANLKAPTGTAYIIRTEDAKSQTAYITVLSNKINTQKGQVNFYQGTDAKYKGAFMESTCIVNSLVDGNGTIDPSCAGNYTFPEIHKYIKVIKNSPNDKRFNLKYSLIEIMAAKMADAIIGSISQSNEFVQSSTTNWTSSASQMGTGAVNKGITAKDTVDVIQREKARRSRVLMKAKRILLEELSEGYGKIAEVDSLFRIQARENRERGLKSLQK